MKELHQERWGPIGGHVEQLRKAQLKMKLELGYKRSGGVNEEGRKKHPK